MKLVNNNISPLPFYDDLSYQNHRKDYAFGQIYPLIVHSNMLIPFQVVLSDGSGIVSVILHSYDGLSDDIDITDSLNGAGLELHDVNGVKVLRYFGNFPIKEPVAEGLWYFEIVLSHNDGDNFSIYSDIFNVCVRVEDYLYLEYSNPYNFELKNGVVDFSSGFKFKCWLNTQIGKPEYTFEEESTSRMGYTFIESQVSKKIYKFTVLAPEYLCDALRIVRLCANKAIRSKGLEYEPISFAMEPKWETQGDLAAVECEFETDNVVANIGGFEVAGDFNNDFNDDFNDD